MNDWITEQRKINTERYRSPEWSKFAAERKDYDGNKCLKCGSVNSLEVNHKKYVSVESWYTQKEFLNLETLCRPCHQQYSRRHGHGVTKMSLIDDDIQKFIDQKWGC